MTETIIKVEVDIDEEHGVPIVDPLQEKNESGPTFEAPVVHVPTVYRIPSVQPVLLMNNRLKNKGDKKKEIRKDGEPRPSRKKIVPPCEYCGRPSRSTTDLKNHIRTHTDERPYMCTECGKTFRQLGHMRDHVAKHSGEKPFKCSVCDSSFYRNTDLDRHFKIHTGDKPYSCMICSKSFVQKCNLTQHIKAHNGERNFECEVCFKKFMTNSKLKLHMNRHDKKKKKNLPPFLEIELTEDIVD